MFFTRRSHRPRRPEALSVVELETRTVPSTLQALGTLGMRMNGTVADAQVSAPPALDSNGLPIYQQEYPLTIAARPHPAFGTIYQTISVGASWAGGDGAIWASARNDFTDVPFSVDFTGANRGELLLFRVNPQGQEPHGVPVPVDIEVSFDAWVCRGTVAGTLAASYSTGGPLVEITSRPVTITYGDDGPPLHWCVSPPHNSGTIRTRVFAKTGEALGLQFSLLGSINLDPNLNLLYPSRGEIRGSYRLVTYEYDLDATSLGWNDPSGQLEYEYRFYAGDGKLPRPVTFSFWWEGASGEQTLAYQRTVDSIDTIAAGTNTFRDTVPGTAIFPSRPADAVNLVMRLDDNNELAETRETNNILRLPSASLPHPVPTIIGLDPTDVPEGSPEFFLTVTGTGFGQDSTVWWDGIALDTTFASGTQLEADVPRAFLADNATHTLTVVNPAPGGGTSNGVTFAVANVVPGLVVVGPSSFDPRSPYELTLFAGGDPGPDTVSQWTINWDDGTPPEHVLANPSAPTQVSHSYPLVPRSYTIRAFATDEDDTYPADGMSVEARLEEGLPPPPAGVPWIPSRGVELATLVVLRTKKLVVRVQFATGRPPREIVSPFQKPAFRAILAVLRDLDGDGGFDAVLFTARRGKKRVRRLVTL